MKSFTVLIVFFVLSLNQSQAQRGVEDTLHTFINQTLKRFEEIPGLSIAVVQDSKTVFQSSYGYSNLENGKPMTNASPYYIASVTKSYMGLLAALLENEGVLTLDTPIDQMLPIRNFKNTSLFSNITIKDLLTHQIGLENNVLTWQLAQIGQYDYNLLAHILESYTFPLHNNKAFKYDNLGYNILELILHFEYGLSWKELLQEKIFDPLEMTHTSASFQEALDKDWPLVTPYSSIPFVHDTPNTVITLKNENTFQAAGGMVSSISDMATWLKIHMGKGSINTNEYFNSQLFTHLHEEIAENREDEPLFSDHAYGLGWNIGKFNEYKAIYHNGGFEGFFSHVSFLPEENIGLVILVNEHHFGDNVANLIAEFAYDLYLGNKPDDEAYKEKTEVVRKKIDGIHMRVSTRLSEEAQKSWRLKYSIPTYIGVYKNEVLGDMIIEEDSSGLIVTLGISKSHAFPSNTDDAILVSFRSARYEQIQFISMDNEVKALVFEGFVFEKLKD